MAILFNFVLNNLWTFAQSRLHGLSAVIGFFKFNAACAVGAVANYATAAFLFSSGFAELLSVIIGAFVGVFWNYTINRLMTWKEENTVTPALVVVQNWFEELRRLVPTP